MRTARTARTARRIAALALVAAALPAAPAAAHHLYIEPAVISSVTVTPRSGAASMDLAAAPERTPILIGILLPAVRAHD